MFKKTTNPRLIDAFDLPFTQEEVDFAVPHLKEDIPLYLDPFLMWSSDNEKYHQLHTKLISFFETIRIMVTQHKATEAMRLLSKCGEVRELGLGYSLGSKRGNAIGRKLIGDILSAYDAVPQLLNSGFKHIEELQLIVPGIAEDRISDITSSILKDYFIEFTTQKAKEFKIPVRTFLVD